MITTFPVDDYLVKLDAVNASIVSDMQSIQTNKVAAILSVSTLPPLVESIPSIKLISSLVDDIHKAKLGGWIWSKAIGDTTYLTHTASGDKYRIYSTPDIAKKDRMTL